MKKIKILFGTAAVAIAGFFIVAADHIDAPAVSGGTSDITDFYAFQGEDTDNIAFVVNLRGLLSPTETASAVFDENVLVEINIDTDGDAIEDLVIQAIPRGGKMYVFGPTAPSSPAASLNSVVQTNAVQTSVDITAYGSPAVIATGSTDISVFAGPRDDPFFFDLVRYQEVLGGATSFNDPGVDFFEGMNVLSIVIEVPKTLIGGTGSINTWVETKSK